MTDKMFISVTIHIKWTKILDNTDNFQSVILTATGGSLSSANGVLCSNGTIMFNSSIAQPKAQLLTSNMMSVQLRLAYQI